LLTRYSAVALFVLALAHFSMTHFVYDPANQSAEWITQMRWNSLALRLLDWSMLFIVLVHSFLGMRTVVKDYLKGTVQDIVLTLLWILAAALVVLGSNVVLTLPLK
jgi:succinate dehydrogenase hydrophobic anchor subunit